MLGLAFNVSDAVATYHFSLPIPTCIRTSIFVLPEFHTGARRILSLHDARVINSESFWTSTILVMFCQYLDNNASLSTSFEISPNTSNPQNRYMSRVRYRFFLYIKISFTIFISISYGLCNVERLECPTFILIVLHPAHQSIGCTALCDYEETMISYIQSES
jgi:hypothetical protein